MLLVHLRNYQSGEFVALRTVGFIFQRHRMILCIKIVGKLLITNYCLKNQNNSYKFNCIT